MDVAKEPFNLIFATALLLSVEPLNHGNAIDKSINLASTLSTVVVEPTYLQQINSSQK